MAPLELITEWAQKANAVVEVDQPDDGSGYSVLIISTPQGEFSVTVDSAFREAPGGMDPNTGRAPQDDWFN